MGRYKQTDTCMEMHSAVMVNVYNAKCMYMYKKRTFLKQADQEVYWVNGEVFSTSHTW